MDHSPTLVYISGPFPSLPLSFPFPRSLSLSLALFLYQLLVGQLAWGSTFGFDHLTCACLSALSPSRHAAFPGPAASPLSLSSDLLRLFAWFRWVIRSRAIEQQDAPPIFSASQCATFSPRHRNKLVSALGPVVRCSTSTPSALGGGGAGRIGDRRSLISKVEFADSSSRSQPLSEFDTPSLLVVVQRDGNISTDKDVARSHDTTRPSDCIRYD